MSGQKTPPNESPGEERLLPVPDADVSSAGGQVPQNKKLGSAFQLMTAVGFSLAFLPELAGATGNLEHTVALVGLVIATVGCFGEPLLRLFRKRQSAKTACAEH